MRGPDKDSSGPIDRYLPAVVRPDDISSGHRPLDVRITPVGGVDMEGLSRKLPNDSPSPPAITAGGDRIVATNKDISGVPAISPHGDRRYIPELSDRGSNPPSTPPADIPSPQPEVIEVQREGVTSEARREVLPKPPDKLFKPIETFGDPEKPKEEKVEVVGKAEDILTQLGVHPCIVAQVAEAREQTEQLSTQVLTRPPVGEERTLVEGRGVYHTDVQIAGRDVTVYVKGTGSEQTFREEGESPFPGFPSPEGRLFFDPTYFAPHPRIVGTETLTWGLMEEINSAVIFAQLVEQYGWTSLEEALDAGVTIPLSTTHYKELSTYIQGLLVNTIEKTDDKAQLPSLQWQGNFLGLGSITQIVPSDKRVDGGIRDAATIEERVTRLTDPEAATVAGRTLRELFDAGYVYSRDSSHGQNLYNRGLVAQADSSDLVCLGDYKGVQEYEWNPETIITIPAEVQRTLLLVKQLERADFLTPLHYPDVNVDVSWTQVVSMQENFWGQMLEGQANPLAIPTLARLMPYLRSEINLAVAQTLVQNADQQRWEAVASQRQALMDRYAAYGVPQEYAQKVNNNLNEVELYPFMDITQRDKVPLQALTAFLQSGNVQDLLQDMRTAEAYHLMQAIDTVEDRKTREEIIHWCGSYFGMRDIGPINIFSEPDQQAYFEGELTRLVRQRVQEGQYSDAVNILKTLHLSNRDGFSTSCLEGSVEPSQFRYPRMLLETDNIQEVYEQCLFDYLLTNYAYRAQPFSIEKVMSDIINRSGPTETYNIIYYVGEHGLPPPQLVIRKLLGEYQDDATRRAEITQWLETYFEKRVELDREDDPRFIDQAVVDQLDAMAVEVHTTYPELAFGHASAMAHLYGTTDQQKAEAYYNEAAAYYETTLEQRQSQLGINVSAKVSNFDSQHAALAETYNHLGFPLLARRFEQRADHSFDRIW